MGLLSGMLQGLAFYLPIAARALAIGGGIAVTIGAMAAAYNAQLALYEEVLQNAELERFLSRQAQLLEEHPLAKQQAINDALAKVAAATGVAVEALKRRRLDLKPFFIVKSLFPDVYKHKTEVLENHPNWYLLTYHASESWKVKNRKEALAANPGWMVGAPSGYTSPDEFPYACTLQGGEFASVRAVPWWQNSLEGSYLGVFTKYTLKSMPGDFLIVPVPI